MTHACVTHLAMTPNPAKPSQVAWPAVVLLPPLMALNALVRPGKSAAVYLPSTLLRYLAFKLTVDVQQLPALQVGGS